MVRLRAAGSGDANLFDGRGAVRAHCGRLAGMVRRGTSAIALPVQIADRKSGPERGVPRESHPGMPPAERRRRLWRERRGEFGAGVHSRRPSGGVTPARRCFRQAIATRATVSRRRELFRHQGLKGIATVLRQRARLTVGNPYGGNDQRNWTDLVNTCQMVANMAVSDREGDRAGAVLRRRCAPRAALSREPALARGGAFRAR
jgi:hypothetical protein